MTKTTKIPKNHRPVKAVSRTNLLPLVLVIGIILLVLSLVVNVHSVKPTTSTDQHQSSAFQGRDLVDPLALPPLTTAISFPIGTSPFGINIPASSSAISINFLYQCSDACQEIWLEYQIAQNNKQWFSFPVHHPVFESLNKWYRVFSHNTVLYQKHPLAFSPSDLIKQPLSLLTEEHLIQEHNLQSQKPKVLNETSSLENIDAVFLSRLPQADVFGWHQYKTIFKTTGIYHSDPNTISFRLRTQTPLKILRLEVTYKDASLF